MAGVGGSGCQLPLEPEVDPVAVELAAVGAPEDELVEAMADERPDELAPAVAFEEAVA